MDTQLPPPVVLYQLASAHYVSQALYVAAQLGIADLLADGPQTHETLAAKTGTHAPSLRRVLRLLATAGVFAEGADALRAHARRLVPAQWARLVPRHCTALRWSHGLAGLGRLAEHRADGRAGVQARLRDRLLRHFADHPAEAAVFDEAMSTSAA